MSETVETCDTCRFSKKLKDPRDDREFLVCRRRSPGPMLHHSGQMRAVLVMGDSGHHALSVVEACIPTVHGVWWCGEWEESDEAAITRVNLAIDKKRSEALGGAF